MNGRTILMTKMIAIMVVRAVDYNKYRLGYVQSGQMPIKFRKPREKKQ